MAKFCGNCGAQMEDNAVVCGYCGVGMENSSVGGAKQFKVKDPEKKKKIKKYITIGASVVAAIIVISILGSIISNFTGYKGCLRKTMKAFEKSDMSAFSKIVTSSMDELDEDESDYWMEEAIEWRVNATHDTFEDKVGHNYKVSYEVDEYFALEGRKFDNLIDEIEYYDDIDASIIDKIEIAEITVTAKKGKKSSDIQIQVVMSKENGSWKLLGIYSQNSF